MTTIVVARIEQETIIVKEGQIDIGRPHVFGTRPKPVAMCWVNEGTNDDLEKANAWAKREGYRVFAYPTTEPDPLSRAREDVMK